MGQIKKQYPDLDIRMFFMNDNVKIPPAKTTTYADWAKKTGYEYYTFSKDIVVEHNNKKELCNVIARLAPVMDSAIKKYERHPSVEHSLTVLLEEVEELKQEVFKKNRVQSRIAEEALDVAFTAIRMVADNGI